MFENTRHDLKFLADVARIADALERIADVVAFDPNRKPAPSAERKES